MYSLSVINEMEEKGGLKPKGQKGHLFISVGTLLCSASFVP